MASKSPPARQVVLVVEDEPLLRIMAADLVEDAGYEAVEASDASEAIRILEARADIRIVFTDIDMPGGLDGLRLAAMIRDRWPPIDLIITSGQVYPDYANLPARSVFFSKPYRRDQVVAQLHDFARH